MMNNLTKISLCIIALFCGSISSLAGENPTQMKELKVKKIIAGSVQANTVPVLMDKENVMFQPVDVVNWDTYPYRPDVSFRIAYTDNAILLHYKVKEKSVRGHYGKDDDPVYTDSCVEFFISPAGDEVYYNFECNCVGTILQGGGKPGDRDRATPSVMNQIDRWSSLGRTPFEERTDVNEWEVALVIPFTTFYKHDISSLQGKAIRANFYKCGDELSTPHFVSWNPIAVETPNFHLPEYFGTLLFE